MHYAIVLNCCSNQHQIVLFENLFSQISNEKVGKEKTLLFGANSLVIILVLGQRTRYECYSYMVRLYLRK